MEIKWRFFSIKNVKFFLSEICTFQLKLNYFIKKLIFYVSCGQLYIVDGL